MKLLAYLLILSIFGFVTENNKLKEYHTICNNGYDNFNFNETIIEIYPTTHGDYIKSPDCPEKIFGVNYGKSKISSDKYKDLLEEMQTNANTTLLPVVVKASGYVITYDENNIYNPTVYIVDIIKF